MPPTPEHQPSRKEMSFAEVTSGLSTDRLGFVMRRFGGTEFSGNKVPNGTKLVLTICEAGQLARNARKFAFICEEDAKGAFQMYGQLTSYSAKAKFESVTPRTA